MISIYFKYLLYVLEHKWNVGIECFKKGMLLHALTHDLSKLRPSEFIPYARFFYETDRMKNYKQSDERNENFQKGWNHHQKRNKHHWNYWISVTRKDEIVSVPMPRKYVRQMVADWNGMARKFGGETKEYFENNRDNMLLHEETIRKIEEELK